VTAVPELEFWIVKGVGITVGLEGAAFAGGRGEEKGSYDFRADRRGKRQSCLEQITRKLHRSKRLGQNARTLHVALDPSRTWTVVPAISNGSVSCLARLSVKPCAKNQQQSLMRRTER
jgi:hypothetical protein